VFGIAVRQSHTERARVALGRGDLDRPALDAISLQFIAADRVQLGRIDPVAREIAVQRVRGPVPRLAFVAQEHAPPAPSEHQGRTQAGRTATNYDHVEHAADLCKTITTCVIAEIARARCTIADP
jgi:hypothetical protein